MQTGPMFVVQTWFFLENLGGRYEIELAEYPFAPRQKFTTRDRLVYQDCLDCEGHPIRVIATYHHEGGQRILDALTPVPPEGRP